MKYILALITGIVLVGLLLLSLWAFVIYPLMKFEDLTPYWVQEWIDVGMGILAAVLLFVLLFVAGAKFLHQMEWYDFSSLGIENVEKP